MWSLCGWVMKMTPISVNFKPAFASRRRVPSPASIRYNVPLTINKFDDCAWCATGTGPTRVPSVMRRVPDCVGEALDVCAPASRACQNTAAQTNAILQSVEMDLRGLTLLSRGLGSLQSATESTTVVLSVTGRFGVSHCIDYAARTSNVRVGSN